VTDAPNNQEERILWVLQAAWPNWTPAPELAKISLQYSARIFSLRRRRGWLIDNRVRTVNGKKHGEFRLGSRPVPSNRELRAVKALTEGDSLFGDLSPDRTYRE
jgi:hypothetical protein